MLPTFPYMAMTITGILHVIFGVVIFINAMVGFGTELSIPTYEWQRLNMYGIESLSQVVHVYLGVVTGASLWVSFLELTFYYFSPGFIAFLKYEDFFFPFLQNLVQFKETIYVDLGCPNTMSRLI